MTSQLCYPLEIQKVDKGQAHNSLIQTSDLKSAMSRVTLWRELWRHKHPSAKAELNLHLLLWHLELSSAFDLDKTQKRTKIEIFHSNPDVKTTISQAFSFFSWSKRKFWTNFHAENHFSICKKIFFATGTFFVKITKEGGGSRKKSNHSTCRILNPKP